MAHRTCPRGNGDLSEKPDVEIPPKRQVLRDTNPKTIQNKAAKVSKEDEINTCPRENGETIRKKLNH